MEEKTSPSFKQALRVVMKRNIVRLAILLILVVVWAVISEFRSGDQYSISPHTLAKVTLARVQSPSRLLFTINDPKEKRVVNAEILALDTTGFSTSLNQQCSEELLKRLENQPVWIRSAYLGSQQQTIGKVMVSKPSSTPEDVGLGLIQTGCAFYCRKDEKYLAPADQKLYQDAEENAQKNHLGIWADSSVKPSAECRSSSLGGAS
jgi:endonuclease YncB( thermonuclease family)